MCNRRYNLFLKKEIANSCVSQAKLVVVVVLSFNKARTSQGVNVYLATSLIVIGSGDTKHKTDISE